MQYLSDSGDCIALADVDNDGDVEIAVDGNLLDHEGNKLVTVSNSALSSSAVILADLDGDDDMELVQPNVAYHHDGSAYYPASVPGDGRTAIADFDNDGLPEILIGGNTGISMLEHDGTPKFTSLKPVGGGSYARPPAVHDIDGDGIPNFMLSKRDTFAVFEPDATVVWQRPVHDVTGAAGSTAFDFLGDGGAEAMYGDEQHVWVFDSDGTPKIQEARSAVTLIEYPVVADVDNDGSAEIVVTSSAYHLWEDPPSEYNQIENGSVCRPAG